VIGPRDEVEHSSFAEHGGKNALRRNAKRGLILDFSVCLNAFGPAEVVRTAAASASISEYPDPKSRTVRAAAAAQWNVSEREIVFGAGSAELIHAICFAYIRLGDRVLIGAPGFGEYARAAHLCGGRVTHEPFSANVDHAARFVDSIATLRPRLVFVASPINPTGEVVPTSLLTEIADACATVDALLVVDQAYDAFTETPVDGPALCGHANVAHLRSLTKEHALAGIRAGFAIAPVSVAVAIEAVRVPWASSAPAQAAAISAFSETARAHVTRTTTQLRTERERLAAACESLGIETHPSDTHFLIARVGDGASAKASLLANHNILIRDCTSFGFPEWIRIAARTPSENDRLIEALHLISARTARHASV
jgi:histidinol-phosphate aminotransferase